MAVAARKYNPGFLTDDELVASFCVRTTEFESLVEVLRECTGNSNPHQIVIGPRGSGKTSLLLRIAAEVRRDAELATSFFPIVFAEESYEVATVGDFWLECLSHLTDQAPRQENDPDLRRTYEELRTIGDNQVMADRCLGALLDFSDQAGKRLLLMVENLNMMLSDMTDSDAGWRLRKILQTEPRIILFASAISRFDEIDNPKQAMYDLFGVRALLPLETSECAALWETVAGRCPPPETIRSLQILTGGSPRWLVILAHFGSELSFRKLMDDLLDLVDDHTEYFKSHLESLPAQERRVYLALATLWKPATTREISDHTRIETSKCSAQLKRLIDRGAVQAVGGSARRKHYYLTERLYNIYYLLRRHGRSGRLVEALIRFMDSYYSPAELKDIGAGIAREAGSFGEETQSLARITLKQLMELPAMAGYRDELQQLMPDSFAKFPGADSTIANVASATEAAMNLDSRGAEQLHEDSDDKDESAAKQLFASAVALNKKDRPKEALAIFDEIVRYSEESENPATARWVATALFMKGLVLERLDRKVDALATYDEMARRFAKDKNPNLAQWVAPALLKKGALLIQFRRPTDALNAYHEVVSRFGQDETPTFVENVARALVRKGALLCEMKQPRDALVAYDDAVGRFDEDEIPYLIDRVRQALAKKGPLPGEMKQSRKAVVLFEKLMCEFGEDDTPAVIGEVAFTLLRNRDLLCAMKQPQDSLAAIEDLVRRFEEDETPSLVERVAQALVMKGLMFHQLNQGADALTSYDEVVKRFRESGNPALHRWVKEALLGRVEVELEDRRFEAAAETIGRLLAQSQSESEKRLGALAVRAQETLAGGNRSACERDVEAFLALLPEIGSLSRDSLDALMLFSVALGPERMRDLIKASPSANLLLPLATALELELGLEPRVAREVEEVAEDVQRDLTQLRETGTMTSVRKKLANLSDVHLERKNA